MKHLLLAIASLAFADFTSFLVLARNQEAGIYPVDADSIGIPVMEEFLLSLAVLVLLAAALRLPGRSRIGRTVGVALCLAAGALSLLAAMSWAIPHHYEMLAAHGLVAGVCGWLAVACGRGPAQGSPVADDHSEIP